MKIDKILGIIKEKLDGINYAFIGSVNLYVQGIGVQPRDIDILTTLADIKKIDKILEKYRIKDIYFDESEGRNSYRSFYKIDSVEIEVLGNVNNIARQPEALGRKILINFNGINLPCFLLTDELEAYRKMGRAEKVEIIEKFLGNK
ncbi:MAG: hypothetical protein UU87_C0002G0060 [Parcubacteria group bacterium GW2011_GWA2_42_11]|nr:MAG: hypothetical protein UU87_C0002G0060 [Parcubacteria group bacterium GW2011_GWA2_42_11]